MESSSSMEWRGGVLAVSLADRLLSVYGQYVRVVSFISANYHDRLVSVHGSSACTSAHHYDMEPPTELVQELGTFGPDGCARLYLCCNQNLQVG